MADLNLHWVHRWFRRFCFAITHVILLASAITGYNFRCLKSDVMSKQVYLFPHIPIYLFILFLLNDNSMSPFHQMCKIFFFCLTVNILNNICARFQYDMTKITL